MARGKCTFKQSDATRAMKSAIAAGLEVVKVTVTRDGDIEMVTAKGDVRDAAVRAWDKVK